MNSLFWRFLLDASCIWKTQLYIKYFLAKLCSTCEADQPHDLVLRFLTEQDVPFASPVWTYNVWFMYSSYFYFTEQSNFSASWNPTYKCLSGWGWCLKTTGFQQCSLWKLFASSLRKIIHCYQTLRKHNLILWGYSNEVVWWGRIFQPTQAVLLTEKKEDILKMPQTHK